MKQQITYHWFTGKEPEVVECDDQRYVEIYGDTWELVGDKPMEYGPNVGALDQLLLKGQVVWEADRRTVYTMIEVP